MSLAGRVGRQMPRPSRQQKRAYQEAVGEQIQFVREACNLKQFQLADALNTTRQSMGEIERGHRATSVLFIARIAQILRCPTGWLLPDWDETDASIEKLQTEILERLPWARILGEPAATDDDPQEPCAL